MYWSYQYLSIDPKKPTPTLTPTNRPNGDAHNFYARYKILTGGAHNFYARYKILTGGSYSFGARM